MASMKTIVGKTTIPLFRLGSKTSPCLNQARPIQLLPRNNAGMLVPPPYNDKWAKHQFPGVTTWNHPMKASESIWEYHVGSEIPKGLMLIQDNLINYKGESVEQWSWVPEKVIALDEFNFLLAQAQTCIQPPFKPNCWRCLSDERELTPIPPEMYYMARHCLEAVAAKIKMYRSVAQSEGGSETGRFADASSEELSAWYERYLSNRDEHSSLEIPHPVHLALDSYIPSMHAESKKQRASGNDMRADELDQTIVVFLFFFFNPFHTAIKPLWYFVFF
eukprot:Phypoly_transcript_12894.p1 GENE.Phypoly_transcript_12894~~Phypoly_transcript_12894.p1  ORF type:complete len:276 (+),score=24.72 Phypoly_transcript_12894:62-889(+)